MALHALVERYEARESAIHRADARLKLLAALACIFAVTLTREGDAIALALLAPADCGDCRCGEAAAAASCCGAR